MRHVILGTGNLGIDLEIRFRKSNYDTILFHIPKEKRLSQNEKYFADLLSLIKEFEPDVVWNCIGCGSVPEGKNNFFEQWMDCVYINYLLINTICPLDIHYVCFSSNYSIDPTSSLYASNKEHLENMVFNLQNTYNNLSILRVANLYGAHKRSGLPFKIMDNNYEKGLIKLPLNKVAPTPTPWLANVIVDYLEQILSNEVQDLWPSNPITVKEVGEFLFNKTNKTILCSGFDNERPHDIEDSDIESRDCLELLDEYMNGHNWIDVIEEKL